MSLNLDWIVLRCPKCSKVLAVERFAYVDPPTATLVEIQCPPCNGGDFDYSSYYNENGKEVW